jgi:transposase
MELLTMSTAELDRLRVLERVRTGAWRQADASQELGLSERQVRRLLRRLEAGGSQAMASKRRGKAPNNRHGDDVRAAVLERYRGEYRGFGPTFLAQTLQQRDGIAVSREWLRALLIAEKLWQPKNRRRSVHPLRQRRQQFGELIQMDGSPHDWFEDRGPRATLLLAIDDATSLVSVGRFEAAETTDGYFRLIRAHIERFGRFGAAYVDKHSIFRYSRPTNNLDVTTQVQRALDELEIELVCANSPQAKGRVERANRTFQDRLIKAMRLEQISTLKAANQFLPAFIEDHNRRFALQPANAQDAHRGAQRFNLDLILCRHKERVLTKNLMFQLGDACFALTDSYSRRQLSAGSRVLIRLPLDGPMIVEHQDHTLTAEPVGKLTRTAPIVGSKDLNAYLDRRTPDPRKVRTPAKNHPWKKTYKTPPAAV